MLKKIIIFIAGCLIIYIIVNVVLIMIGYSRIYESTDIKTYRDFGVPLDGGSPSLRSFPDNLEEVETINNYYFSADFPVFGHTWWEIFLDVTYSEEKFYLELDRLSNFIYKERKLKFDSNCFLFNYPTYVAKYDTKLKTYEYIMIDDINFRIIYIFLERREETKVSLEYLPKNYFKNLDEETSDGYFYSIYYGSNNWFD